jgi:hypothetical protein
VADPFPVPESFGRRNWEYRCSVCGGRLVFGTAEVMRQAETRMAVCCGLVLDLTGLPLADEE